MDQEKEKKIRVFIALEIDSKVRNELARIQKELQILLKEPSIRWVSVDQIHLTLKFLGYTSAQSINPLKERLKNICETFEGFELCTRDLGGFPSLRKAEVLWVGLDKEITILESLQTKIEEAAVEFSEEKSKRKFRAHLTLGRVRRASEKRNIAKILANHYISFGTSWFVKKVSLYQSHLSPKGPVYEVLWAGELKLRRL
jgi:RNA 2',3'-cyclic 3'-phosphodiesterase